jgi:hypothetical protein
MAHNFTKQSDGSKVCQWCGDEKGIDEPRACPNTQPTAPSGKFPMIAAKEQTTAVILNCVFRRS